MENVHNVHKIVHVFKNMFTMFKKYARELKICSRNEMKNVHGLKNHGYEKKCSWCSKNCSCVKKMHSHI